VSLFVQLSTATLSFSADVARTNPAEFGDGFTAGLSMAEGVGEGSRDVPGVEVWATDLAWSLGLAEPAQFQQPVAPQLEATSAVALPAASTLANQQLASVFGVSRSPLSTPILGTRPAGIDSVLGGEATIRATTDAGDLLGSSPAILGLGIQTRNPIVTDPRVRGNRVGSLAASGSYWVPARIDLDTVLSKIDSRIVEQMIVIPGPYSALYGPGFEFVDVELRKAPRYAGGFETHGQSSVDYKANGQQWYGRQSVWGGSTDWGFRAGYGHSTGNDYVSGDNRTFPSSYKSRDIDLAFGGDLTENSSLDFHYLRLDQTDIELAGQAFDIDVLKTDGYELQYLLRDQAAFDQLLVEGWYNRTEFTGSAQRPSKRAQFPYLDFISFTGRTDVDSMSTGYRAGASWDGANGERLTAGTDLRYVKQELNEITSGRIQFLIWTDANSPIPRSHSSNPGLFVELSKPVRDDLTITTGGRVDWVSTNIEEGAAELAALGVAQPQSSADQILGSDAFDQDNLLGSAYVSLDREHGEGWTSGASFGYAERAPNLTERYAVEPFMFLLQSGLNTVTGDPLLDKERRLQFDVRAGRRTENFRGSVTGYHAWIHDYITFENMSTVIGPPNGDIVQANLKYVNTDLATLLGCEARGEVDLAGWLTPFATLKYVHGTDEARDGNFATRQATPGLPSTQVAGLPRGTFSGVVGGPSEALPGILPLESRLGARIGPASDDPDWGLEVHARVVDNQNRVAASLLETPTPGFTIWDVRTFWRPYEDVLVVAGVENFTDKAFREHLDFRAADGMQVLQPGVNFYLGGELTY
jgi:outer membrane receptor protein involved in Fe transport